MDSTKSGRDRRIHRRISREDLNEPAVIRIPNKPPVSLVDVSSGGALIDLPFQMRPDSEIKVELQTASKRLIVPFKLLRCYVTSINGAVRYQAAGSFEKELELAPLLGGHIESPTSRLTNILEAFLHHHGSNGEQTRVAEFDHMLSWILDAVRRGEKPDRISLEITLRLKRLIPTLAIEPSRAAFLPDPSKGARFFGIDFTSQRPLTATDRRVLRAAAQLLSIINGDPQPVQSPVRRRDPLASPITYSVADWQEMQLSEQRLRRPA